MVSKIYAKGEKNSSALQLRRPLTWFGHKEMYTQYLTGTAWGLFWRHLASCSILHMIARSLCENTIVALNSYSTHTLRALNPNPCAKIVQTLRDLASWREIEDIKTNAFDRIEGTRRTQLSHWLDWYWSHASAQTCSKPFPNHHETVVTAGTDPMRV